MTAIVGNESERRAGAVNGPESKEQVKAKQKDEVEAASSLAAAAERRLDTELEDSFPASDPPALTQISTGSRSSGS